MIIVSTKQAVAGMVLAAPVQQPGNPGHYLVKPGVRLDEPTLARLRELKVGSLFVEFEPLEDLDRHVALMSAPARESMHTAVRGTYEGFLANKEYEPPFGEMYACSRALIPLIGSQGPRPVLFDSGGRSDADLPGHAAAVAHLSLMLGMKLERYLIQQRSRLPAHHAKEVVNLGVAAMLHDIGKTRIAPALHRFNATRLPADSAPREQWQSHTRVGYEMVKGGVEASAACAILHHHQQYDGGGFPRLTLGGKRVIWAGKKLHVFARILALANAFDRLTVRTDPTRVLSNLQALHLLRHKFTGKFDGVILKALHQVCPPFPPGSIVTLDDGTAAVVVHVDDDHVYRPVVRRLAPPAKGQVLPQLVGDAVDLRIDPSRRVILADELPTDGLLCTSAEIDAIALRAEDADEHEDTVLKGAEAERAYSRQSKPIRRPNPIAPNAPRAGGRIGGAARGVEELPEPDLDDLSPPITGTAAA